jgi:hypothetical protein
MDLLISLFLLFFCFQALNIFLWYCSTIDKRHKYPWNWRVLLGSIIYYDWIYNHE